jgi:hypothetical protein
MDFCFDPAKNHHMNKAIVAALILISFLIIGFLLLPGPEHVPYAQQTTPDTPPPPSRAESPDALTPMP